MSKIGGGQSDWASLSSTQWGYACSAAGSRSYPYGNALEPGRCIDETHGTLRPAREAALRAGANAGLYDMSGNVWEWQHECSASSTPRDDTCQSRGGAFSTSNVACTAWSALRRIQFSGDTGFRCCSD